ncbi:ABC transporter [Vibrio cholerae]|nr:ABC transporter [Vibrio cholerae]
MWVPVIGVLILVIYSFLIQSRLKRAIEEGSRLASQKYANLIESLAGLETVKLFGAQGQFQYRWEEAVAHMANWNIKSRRITDSIQNTAGHRRFCAASSQYRHDHCRGLPDFQR